MKRLSKRTLLWGAIPLSLLIVSSALVRGFEDLPPPKPSGVAVPPPPAAKRPIPSTRAPAAPLTAPPQVVVPPSGINPPASIVVPPPGTAPAPNVVIPPAGPNQPQLEGFQRIGKQIFDNFVNPGANGQPQQPPVLPNELNAGIKGILDRLTSGDRAIESLQIQFDPQETDFARDTAKINANAVLRHSAWSKSPSRFNLGLGARIENAPNMPSRAVVGGDLNLQTDVLALANHFLPRIKKRLGVESDGRIVEEERPAAERPLFGQNEPRRPIINRLLRGPRDTAVNVQAPAPIPAPAPANPVDGAAVAPVAADHSFKRQLQEKLARTGTLKSMDELVDLVTYMAGLNICMQNEKIENLMVASETAPTDLARREALQELAEARAKRDAMLFTRLSINRDSAGIARGFEINMANSAVVTGTRIENLHVVVSEQEIKVSGNSSLFQGLEFYPLLKPLVMNFLRGVQSRDAVLIDPQNGPFSGFWRQGREAVVGPPEAVPVPQ